MVVIANIAIGSKNVDLIDVLCAVRKVIWQSFEFLMVSHVRRIISGGVESYCARGIVCSVVKSRDLLTPMWIRLLPREVVVTLGKAQ